VLKQNGQLWDKTLAGLKSDPDSFTNGAELGDPTGTLFIGVSNRNCTYGLLSFNSPPVRVDTARTREMA